MTINTGNIATLNKINNTQSAAVSRITTVKAISYMKEWLHFTSIKKIPMPSTLTDVDDNNYIYFTVKNYPLGEKLTIRIEQNTVTDSFNMYEQSEGSRYNWEWYDAIPVNSEEE